MASGSKKVIYAALVGNSLIAITKFAASWVTGSSAMLAEGIHSLVDTGNQGLLLYGLHKANRPPDERYPFGYGKEIYFWSFAVAVLVFAFGAGVSIYEGVLHVLEPHPMENPMVNYIVLSLALVFEGGAWYLALKEFTKVKGQWSYFQAVQRGKDPTIFMVLFEDTAAVLGLGVAFIGILLGQVTGIPYFDGLATIIIGCILGGIAVWLAHETKGLLIGESANQEVVVSIREMAKQLPGVVHVNEVLTMHMGPEFILVNLSVDFRDGVTSEEVERCVATLDKDIKVRHPLVKRVFVEAEARSRKEGGKG
ncbi:MAG: cation transporter [Nitrospira sp.]|nr:cation transporter [Nitrospira sp.]MCB9709871.1 cation transporter [Nitrospiraceae bacterium]MDR4485922.1 cation diffusion facilitator family transporter [Nitrospirales bacterium]MCA9466014.1 cation transporter [Nitrospira sp.]MCA9474372.1 cation transporter [Nitrospira sp.]